MEDIDKLGWAIPKNSWSCYYWFKYQNKLLNRQGQFSLLELYEENNHAALVDLSFVIISHFNPPFYMDSYWTYYYFCYTFIFWFFHLLNLNLANYFKFNSIVSPN